jgi:hypothetical protein
VACRLLHHGVRERLPHGDDAGVAAREWQTAQRRHHAGPEHRVEIVLRVRRRDTQQRTFLVDADVHGERLVRIARLGPEVAHALPQDLDARVDLLLDERLRLERRAGERARHGSRRLGSAIGHARGRRSAALTGRAGVALLAAASAADQEQAESDARRAIHDQ